jgi:hypothetical protein
MLGCSSCGLRRMSNRRWWAGRFIAREGSSESRGIDAVFRYFDLNPSGERMIVAHPCQSQGLDGSDLEQRLEPAHDLQINRSLVAHRLISGPAFRIAHSNRFHC